MTIRLYLDDVRNPPDDIGHIARFTLLFGAFVCSVVGLVQQRREPNRIRALFAACATLPGCACDDCRAARARTATPPLPEHVGSYRTNPRLQPTLPRKTPWWRLALWWARCGAGRWQVRQRAISLTSKRFFPDLWCHVCFARSTERCDPRRHR